MSKVSTNPEKIARLLKRGVENIYPSPQFLKKQLESGKRLTLYLGIDPSGPTLHMGHTIPMLKLREFQDLGHKVILLIGDFTAMCGDPDKTEVRNRLTKKQVQANMKEYRKQAKKLLKFSGLRFTGANVAEYRFNSKWLSKMTFEQVTELASKVTVQRMLERDLFEKRIKSGKPLYLHEFMYPLMQGYDSVMMDVDGEVGGNDQTFNMLTGRDLVKQYKNKEKFVVTMKLLVDATGKKMGKTEGNMLKLTDSPKEMHGKIMSWTDGMIVPALELITMMPEAEVKLREKGMNSGKLNPRDAKVELAGLVVGFFYGKKAAGIAAMEFTKTFAKKETPDNIATYKLKDKQVDIAELLVNAKMVNSKTVARRLVEQGGIKINQKKITSWKNKVNLKTGDIVQAGKRKFVKIA